VVGWLSYGNRGRDALRAGALFGVGVYEAPLRVNVRWVTPLGDETASTS